MANYDPVPDAIEFLSQKKPIERHAIARLLENDGPSLKILEWIANQPDCDGATAAMIFWRLWSLPYDAVYAENRSETHLVERTPVLKLIAANAKDKKYQQFAIAWDGMEAWDRTPLVDAQKNSALSKLEVEVPEQFFGPFGTLAPEPAKYVFFENPYEDNDIFDSLWRQHPDYVGIADWLINEPAEYWSQIADDTGGHLEEIFDWMIRQPECPQSVGGFVFWYFLPTSIARDRLNNETRDYYKTEENALLHILDRWRAGSFVPSEVDFSAHAGTDSYLGMLAEFPGASDPLKIPKDLLAPTKGKDLPPRDNTDSSFRSFEYWVFVVCFGGLVPRGRAAALEQWQSSQIRQSRQQKETASETGKEKTESNADLTWKKMNFFTVIMTVIFLTLWRGSAPTFISLSAFVLLVIGICRYQSSPIGGFRRLALWWATVAFVTIILAFFFRWIDTGALA